MIISSGWRASPVAASPGPKWPISAKANQNIGRGKFIFVVIMAPAEEPDEEKEEEEEER